MGGPAQLVAPINERGTRGAMAVMPFRVPLSSDRHGSVAPLYRGICLSGAARLLVCYKSVTVMGAE